MVKNIVTIEDFLKLDIRVGIIVSVDDFPEAKKPAYKLKVDLGDEVGIKKSTAQLTQNYTKEKLVGKKVLCVVNFPPRQVGPAISEILTLGVSDTNGNCILVVPEKDAPLGSSLY